MKYRRTLAQQASVLLLSSVLLRSAALDVPNEVLFAHDVVDRESDSYSIDAFVWRDSMPLVTTGMPARLFLEDARGKLCVAR